MALVIRLRRLGARHKPFFRIAVTEAATARDGRFLEELGWYDPKKEGLNSKIDVERVRHWLSKGAQPSETVRAILKKHGLLGGKPAVAAAAAEAGTEAVAEAAIEPEAVPPEPEAEVGPEEEAQPQPQPEQPQEAPPPQEPKPETEPEQPPAEAEQPPAEPEQPKE